MSDVFHDLPDIPEVSPFGVKGWRRPSDCFITLSEGFGNVLAISCFFCIFRGSSYLEVMFWENVGNWPSSIEIFSSSFEEPFEQVKELVVGLCVDSGIFDDEAAIVM